jgi:hypothetical protein
LPVTWDDAFAIANDQIAEWQRRGVGPAEALFALQNEHPAHWQQVRELLAAWAILHRERWEE